MTVRFKNLLDGATSLLGIMPAEPVAPVPFPARKSVSEALRSDWQKLGGDMERALKHYERQHRTKLGA